MQVVDVTILMRLALALIPALWTSACAESLSPYQPRSNGYGYAENEIGELTHRVEFTGNEYTTRETVEAYVLYRAAELTLANGYERFALSDGATNQTEYYSTPYPSGFGYPYTTYGQLRRLPSQPYTPFVLPSYAGPREEIRYRAAATVRFIPKSEQPTKADEVYDARVVMERLEPEIDRPEEGNN